jgi:RecA/RadA recombinase
MTESLARNGELSAVVFDVLDFVWTDPLAASHLAATLNRLPAFLARSGTILLVLHESAAEGSPAAVAPRDGVAWEWRRVASEWGSALAHAATVRLRVVREEWLRQHKDIRGYRASVQVLKNKLGPAGRTASITIEFNGTVRGNGL